MTRILSGLAALLLLLGPLPAGSGAHHSGGSSLSHSHSGPYHSGSASHPKSHQSSVRCYGCPRDSHGKIKRSAEAKHKFRSSHPCPSTGRTAGSCPGYEIDHRVPLFKGGADTPGNMEWLTKEQHKRKTKTEK